MTFLDSCFRAQDKLEAWFMSLHFSPTVERRLKKRGLVPFNMYGMRYLLLTLLPVWILVPLAEWYINGGVSPNGAVCILALLSSWGALFIIALKDREMKQ